MSLSINWVCLPVGSKSAGVEETTLNDYPKFKVGIVLFAVFEILRKVFTREKQLDGYFHTVQWNKCQFLKAFCVFVVLLVNWNLVGGLAR